MSRTTHCLNASNNILFECGSIVSFLLLFFSFVPVYLGTWIPRTLHRCSWPTQPCATHHNDVHSTTIAPPLASKCISCLLLLYSALSQPSGTELDHRQKGNRQQVLKYCEHDSNVMSDSLVNSYHSGERRPFRSCCPTGKLNWLLARLASPVSSSGP